VTHSAGTQTASAQVQFSSPKNYPVGTAPVAVAVGDFNGDGKQDLAVVNSALGPPEVNGVPTAGNGNVSILLGKGDGTFEAAVNYSVSSSSTNSPTSIAVGDFNGDGKLDLAVANGPANTVSILLGNGDGTFQAPSQYNAGAFAGYVTVADFNGDGKLDLLASSGISVSILLGNGDATFQPAIITGVPASGEIHVSPFVAVGDFDGDGHLDLAGAESSWNIEKIGGSLFILLGRGDGTFQPGTTFPIADLFKAWNVATGDFNRSGKVDLAVAAETGIFIMLGNGDGTFSLLPNPQNQVHGGYGFGDTSVAVADLRNDGELDLIGLIPFAHQTPEIQLMLGKGDATFQIAVLNLSLAPNSLAVGDFNGDKLPDLVVTNGSYLDNSVSVMLNATTFK
jgi:VCBS repeat protein/FG-GAP repeat protein